MVQQIVHKMRPMNATSEPNHSSIRGKAIRHLRSQVAAMHRDKEYTMHSTHVSMPVNRHAHTDLLSTLKADKADKAAKKAEKAVTDQIVACC